MVQILSLATTVTLFHFTLCGPGGSTTPRPWPSISATPSPSRATPTTERGITNNTTTTNNHHDEDEDYETLEFSFPTLHPTRKRRVDVRYRFAETTSTLSWDESGNVVHCEFTEDGKTPALVPVPGEDSDFEEVGLTGMLQIIRGCQSLDDVADGRNTQPEGGIVSNALDRAAQAAIQLGAAVGGLVPGTKWCGRHNRASGWNDLGYARELDKCCRTHDTCPLKVRAFKEKHGLLNLNLYTSSHCECDSMFYDCLKRLSDRTSGLMGRFYFDILRLQCIEEVEPPKCLKRSDASSQSCLVWGDDGKAGQGMKFRDFGKGFTSGGVTENKKFFFLKKGLGFKDNKL